MAYVGREANQGSGIYRVFSAIRDNPGITRAEIARLCHLSRPAVSEIVRRLLVKKLVREGEARSTSNVGRKPIKLRIDPNAFFVLSIDVGGTNLRGAVLNLVGEIVWRHQELTQPLQLPHQLENLISRMLETVSQRKVLGIAIGVPGIVDPQAGILLYSPSLNIRDFNVNALVAEKFGIPVLVENDVNLAAVGEWWQGAARGSTNSICISIGTGIGAGLIINKTLYRGSHYLAGEVGHFLLDHELPQTAFNSFGAFELIAGGWGLTQLAKQLMSEEPTAFGGDRKKKIDISAEMLFEASAAGFEKAQALVRRAGICIGIVTANVINLLDVDVVVLTGGIMRQSEQLWPWINQALMLVAIPEVRRRTKVVLGKLNDAAVLIGAAYQAQERWLVPAVLEGHS